MLEIVCAIVFLIATWLLTKLVTYLVACLFDWQPLVTFTCFLAYIGFFCMFAKIGQSISQYEEIYPITWCMVICGIIYIVITNPFKTAGAVGVGAIVGNRPWKD